MSKELFQYLETLVALHRQLLAALLNKAPTAAEETWLDNADVKQLLKISDATLYRLRKSKQLPTRKIGGKCYYPKSALLQLLKDELPEIGG